ncbi:MAG: dockerin type I repeat-containing protein, partial [Oscillospiraceae bacterium]
LDQRVSIVDVTYLRQHLASLRTLTPYQLTFADAYYDNRVSIADAVRIQRNLVDDSVMLGDRVNVTFFDKDGNISVVKSVKYATDLTNIPTLPVLSGYTIIGWSENPNEQTAVNLSNLKENKSVYAIYRKDASAAVTFYKQILTQTYYTNDYLSGGFSLCSDIPYQDNWNAKIYWSSSNNATLNASTGVFSKPIYDANVKLTATIVSYRNGLIEAQDYIDFDYAVTGDFQCPSKAEIKNYLAGLFGDKIKANIALPKRVTNEDVQNQNKKYEVRVNWAVLGHDNTENGIDQITRTAYEQNLTLVANVSFNGAPIEGDGKIYFDDLKLSAITEKEVSDYIIDQIASNTGLSLTTGEFLWNNDTKYSAKVRWISKNTTVASVANNQVTIGNTAVNGAALPLVAEVTYPTGGGAVTFELSYTVSVATNNKLLVPGTNIDENLYDALKTATGVYGNLTTDALKDIKFVYLDLSGYPQITDLSGLTYCTNLRVLNISGLRISRG